MINWEPLWLSAQLAITVTAILLLIGIPVSYALAYSRYRFTIILEALISIPLVLPPSVLGFYLLVAFSPSSTFGEWLDRYFNLRLVFTFEGLVIASVIYSLPFMMNPLLAGFRSIPVSIKEASYTLGKSKFITLVKILIPNMRSSLLTGMVMTFAHTLGEFGVVLMMGGSIPGETQVVSIAIYDEVQSMQYDNANVYASILFSFTFLMLVMVYWINHRSQSKSIV